MSLTDLFGDDPFAGKPTARGGLVAPATPAPPPLLWAPPSDHERPARERPVLRPLFRPLEGDLEAAAPVPAGRQRLVRVAAELESSHVEAVVRLANGKRLERTFGDVRRAEEWCRKELEAGAVYAAASRVDRTAVLRSTNVEAPE